MAYGDVKQNFPKGTLNSYWYYIELCRLLFPDEDGTQIDKLQEALIRYSLISPCRSQTAMTRNSLSSGSSRTSMRISTIISVSVKVLSWGCILTSRMMQSSTWKGR